MSKMYDLIIFIGRLQPPTNAHIETISHALQYSDRVLVLAGSAKQPRTIKNPWTVDERQDMVLSCFAPHDQERISVVGVLDYIYNDQMWVLHVQQMVRMFLLEWYKEEAPTKRVGIIGHSKDESSYYLRMFPQWEMLEMENIDDISATDVRNIYFNPLWSLHKGGSIFEQNVKDKLPVPVGEYLTEFKETDEYAQLVEEYEFTEKYKSQWANTPYPVIFSTTDAVVVQSGHLLLVQRRASPGAGLWALPGGFLGYEERIVDSMIRELREETKLKVPAPVLKGSIKDKEVFDHPGRSLRGRTITHAFYIELPSGPLSKVKGSDDAARAKWIPIVEVFNMSDQLFEDHLSIIKHFLGEA